MSGLGKRLRFVWRTPGFAVPAIALLAGGCVLTTTAYAIFDAVVLRAVPYPRPNELVQVTKRSPALGNVQGYLSRSDADSLLSHARCFSSLGYETDSSTMISETAQKPERIVEASISADFLRTLGLTPVVGRSFTRDDYAGAAPKVAIISFALWARLFSHAAEVVGRHMSVGGVDHVIVGVMPASVKHPLNVADVWTADNQLVPAGLSQTVSDKYVVARLHYARSIGACEKELSWIRPAITIPNSPLQGKVEFHLLSLLDETVGPSKRILLLLGLASALIQIIACLNVGQLLIARRIATTTEFGIRVALGAGFTNILADLLWETSVIGLLSLLISLPTLKGLLPIASAALSSALDREITVQLHASAILFCFGSGLLAIFLCSLFSIFVLRTGDVMTLIHSRWQDLRLPMSTQRLQEVFIVLQLAASVILVSGCGLLAENVYQLTSSKLGFEASNLKYVVFDQGSSRFPSSQMRLHDAMDALSRSPAIQIVAAGSTPILTGARMTLMLDVQEADGSW